MPPHGVLVESSEPARSTSGVEASREIQTKSDPAAYFERLKRRTWPGIITKHRRRAQRSRWERKLRAIRTYSQSRAIRVLEVPSLRYSLSHARLIGSVGAFERTNFYFWGIAIMAQWKRDFRGKIWGSADLQESMRRRRKYRKPSSSCFVAFTRNSGGLRARTSPFSLIRMPKNRCRFRNRRLTQCGIGLPTRWLMREKWHQTLAMR